MDSERLCHIQEIALSDVAGQFDMAIMSEMGGTNSLHFDGSAETPPGGWLRIRTETLTNFCLNNGIVHVHLAKCDTEGNDSKVILGAYELLSRGAIDVLQFEYNHRWVFSRTFLKDVFDLIQELPYRIGKLEPHSVELYDGWHYELDRFFQTNYVLLH